MQKKVIDTTLLKLAYLVEDISLQNLDLNLVFPEGRKIMVFEWRESEYIIY